MRQPTAGAHINTGNVFISEDSGRGKQPQLLAVDHTHVFGSDAVVDGGSASKAVQDDAIYGSFPEFRRFLNERDIKSTLADLSRISFEDVQAILSATPRCWGMTPPAGQLRGGVPGGKSPISELGRLEAVSIAAMLELVVR